MNTAMSSTPNRPKQRILVRWNDDLDKSLLLFITHTCTELGIKIPYDEVAKRMGSTFSEGSIMQHIAKLRNQMEALNVVPVPGPPKRGQITRKPSSVYNQRSRAGHPLPPQPTVPKTRSRPAAKGVQPSKTEGAISKSRPKRRATSRRIKRSSSDPADSEDEFEGEVDAGHTETGLNQNGKRPRRGRSRTAVATASQVDSDRQSGMSYARSIMEKLAEADAKFEAEHGDDADYLYVQDQPIFTTPSTIEGGQTYMTSAPTSSQYAAPFRGYIEPASDEEEEVEEATGFSDLPKSTTNLFGGNTGGFDIVPNYFQPGTGDQISPTATMHAPNPTLAATFPMLENSSQPFSTRDTTLSWPAAQDQDLLSSNMADVGFGGFSNSPHTNPWTSSQPSFDFNASSMLASPIFPSVVESHMPVTASSQTSTRNPSMISQASSQGTPVMSRTPMSSRQINESPETNRISRSPRETLFNSQEFTTTNTAFDNITAPKGNHLSHEDFLGFKDSTFDVPLDDNWMQNMDGAVSSLGTQTFDNFNFI